jgi:predicted O-linked N-acetylglucosamine transferase (SPINDLY family)
MGNTAANILTAHGVEFTEDELAQSGVKGMRWGRRKKQSSSEDSRDAEPSKPRVKDMSDDDLRSAINRLKMEKEFATLTTPQVNAGKKLVGKMLLDIGQQIAKEYVIAQANRSIYGHPGGMKAALAAAEAAAKNPEKIAKAATAVARPVMQLNKNHGL